MTSQHRKAPATYKPIMAVHAYRYERMGLDELLICEHLQITKQTYHNWRERYAELREAVELGRKEANEKEDFRLWVYRRLPHRLRKLWEDIRLLEKEPNGEERIRLLLNDSGKRVKQELFLHALVTSHFSPSRALRRMCMSKKELDEWVKQDAEFADLVEEIQWHKGNFFEEGLVKLVRDGNPAAIIFANKTHNRERGYESRSSVDVNVSGTILAGVLDLDELAPYLSSAAKIELLDAIRSREEAQKRNVLTAEQTIVHTIATGEAAKATEVVD